MVLSFKIWGREDDNNSAIDQLSLSLSLSLCVSFLLLILLSNIIFITNQNIIRDRSKKDKTWESNFFADLLISAIHIVDPISCNTPPKSIVSICYWLWFSSFFFFHVYFHYGFYYKSELILSSNHRLLYSIKDSETKLMSVEEIKSIHLNTKVVP